MARLWAVCGASWKGVVAWRDSGLNVERVGRLEVAWRDNGLCVERVGRLEVARRDCGLFVERVGTLR